MNINRSSDRASVVCGFLAMAVLTTCAVAAPDHAWYLPAGIGFDDISDAQWRNAAGTNAMHDYEVGDHTVGRFEFSYDMWTGRTTAGNHQVYGMGMAGGFWLDPAWAVRDGLNLGWAQVVKARESGQNEWGAPTNRWFPDTNNGRTDPNYPFQNFPIGLDTPPDTQPDAAFQDFPWRYRNHNEDHWSAALAMIAYDITSHTAYLLGGQTWGFSRFVDGFGVENLEMYGGIFDDALGGRAIVLETLFDAFDGNGLSYGTETTSTAWTFISDPHQIGNVFVYIPAPGVGALLVIGGVLACRRRR